jgi:hypothetical protein
MARTLLVLQSLWAMDRLRDRPVDFTLDEKLEAIAAAGFDGISTDWRDRQRARHIASVLRPQGLAMEGTCFPSSIDDLIPVLETGVETGVHHLNIQADMRPRGLSEAVAILEGWMRLAEQVDFPVLVETHRGRMTSDLHFTLDILDRLPELRLLADLSHYVVAREFPIPPTPEIEQQVARILDHAWAFHGRIAGPGQIQLELGFPQHRSSVDLFARWWSSGMSNWLSRSAPGESLTFTCELGPQPYAISGADGRDLTDRWDDSHLLRALVRSLWNTIGSRAS